jgi:hypothetical protein
MSGSPSTRHSNSTHSDAPVSAFTEHVESVAVCQNLGNGTTLQRLDAEHLRAWSEKYRLGELWRISAIGGYP